MACSASAPTKPKTILVTDFVASPDVEAIDRGFSARMDRKGINYPILERKRRTLARVNDEIVASIVATLREAGLDAQPGSEEGLTLNDEAAVVSGRLRAGDAGRGREKPSRSASVAGRGGVVRRHDGVVFLRRRKEAADSPSTRMARPPASRRPESRRRRTTRRSPRCSPPKKTPERLSPDVEAQARRLGRAVGEKVVAYAKEQGWLDTPAVAEAQPEEQVKLPEPKPAQKRVAAKKPAAQAPAAPKSSSKRLDAPEDEEPPDTGPPPGRQ